MVRRRTLSCFAVGFICLLTAAIPSAAGSEPAQTDRAEWQQDMARIKAVEKSFLPGQVNNLGEYERFANEIQGRWKQRDREYYARLMLALCGPLSSGTFPEDRRYDLAGEYALSALSDPARISLETELELIGHVMTPIRIPGAATGQKLADRRREDVAMRLHAWKRLRDAIDPNWDPNEVIVSPNAVAVQMGLPISGMAPEAVKDERRRAKYVAALEENRRKSERYSEQRRLHRWLDAFPRRAEAYIIQLYSEPPFNPGELKQYLKRYGADEEAQARISSAVEQNIEKETSENDNTP
jgi:hypothetical protein